ncbi:MAG: peptidoglycan DD-metalloendopeptidase family protein [Sulfuricellaceae bacterium]|nr:peptidoglycan DD-metalloendopeptidase family protein [Sulfuricellaceae bacterium]
MTRAQLIHYFRSLAGIFLLTCLAPVAVAAPKPELQDVRNRIEALQKELDSKEDAKASAADALKESEQAISELNLSLRELSGQQAVARNNLESIEKQQLSLNQRIVNDQLLLGRLLYQQYRSGQQDQFRILLNQENPNQAARQLRYYTYLAKARNDMLEDLRAHLLKLHQLSTAAEAKQADIDRIKAEQDKDKQELLAQKQAKKQLLTKISAQIGKQRNELSQLQKNEKRLTELIERLAKIEQERKKQEKRPVKTTRTEKTPRTRDAPTAAPEQPDLSLADGSFKKLKGKLPLPVKGELAGRFGAARQDSGAAWRGLFIRTGSGQEVHAIAPGRVVFSDWLRGFGNLIIVDHGDGFMSLYGYNESLFKQAGETLHMGEVIASTGNSGGNAETGLYFELRYQSRPFDPMTWCKTG